VIAKLLKSTRYPDRIVVATWDFPKLNVFGANSITRYLLQLHWLIAAGSRDCLRRQKTPLASVSSRV
jgi:hypothetical protein